jgi:hypothetical protein
VECSVSGILSGYFKVQESGLYDLLLEGKNVGGTLKINNRTVINTSAEMEQLHTMRSLYLPQGKVLTLLIEFFSLSPDGRDISLSLAKHASNNFAVLNSTFISSNSTFINSRYETSRTLI